MKARTFFLGTGYAEDASYSQLILIHPKGFDSIQEGLMDIREGLLTLIRQEQADAKSSLDGIVKFHKDEKRIKTTYELNLEDFLAATPEEAIEPTLYDIIHGSYQDHGDFWEVMSDRGWLIGSAWTTEHIYKYPVILVDRAPEVVAESPNLDEERILFNSPPKGIRELKKVK